MMIKRLLKLIGYISGTFFAVIAYSGVWNRYRVLPDYPEWAVPYLYKIIAHFDIGQENVDVIAGFLISVAHLSIIALVVYIIVQCFKWWKRQKNKT